MSFDYGAGRRARLMHLIRRADIPSANIFTQLHRWAAADKHDMLYQYTKTYSCESFQFAEQLAALVAVVLEDNPNGELDAVVEIVERLCLKSEEEVVAYRDAKTFCISYELYKARYRNNDIALLEKREMKKKPNLGPVMHMIESKNLTTTDKLAKLLEWAKNPKLMNEWMGNTPVDADSPLRLRALFDASGDAMGYTQQHGEAVQAIVQAFIPEKIGDDAYLAAFNDAPVYKDFYTFLKTTDGMLAIAPAPRQLLDTRPVPWPWRSMFSAIEALLENVVGTKTMVELDAYLEKCTSKDGLALLDFFAKQGRMLSPLPTNSHLPDNVVHGNAIAAVRRYFERYVSQLGIKHDEEQAKFQVAYGRIMEFMSVTAAPVGEVTHRYSVTDALIVLLQHTDSVAILPTLNVFLQNCGYFDAQALLDRFTKDGWSLPGLEAVDVVPVEQREKVKEELLRARCSAGEVSQSLEVANAAQTIVRLLLTPMEVKIQPAAYMYAKHPAAVLNTRYTLADAILLVLENVTGVAMLVDLDVFLSTCELGDAQKLIDLFINKGYSLPSLQCLDHIAPAIRQMQMETLLAKRISWVNEGHTVGIQDAAKRIKENMLGHMIGTSGDVTESEQMVLNRIKHHPEAIAQQKNGVPEFLYKFGIDMLEKNALEACAIISQYICVSAGANLSDDQGLTLLKNIASFYTGPQCPQVFNRTMLIEGAGHEYDQALMRALCRLTNINGGLSTFHPHNQWIERAISIVDNPAIRLALTELCREQNAVMGQPIRQF